MKKGIEKIAMLSLMMAAMAEQESKMYITDERNRNREPRPEPVKKDLIPFNKEDGVVRTIKDYSDIKNGISKKGKLKQNRILEKVEDWISKGMLTKEDLL